ncbi:MAG: bifunctional DNA-formamidopyrimidine glycosylase/DNA-(apurinic or apyrimidinic site) lyase [Fluviibacter sp.]|jgi:formamidopyrimidine-DNA glycosylase
MPELPEVEVSRLGLLPELAGRTITGATTRTPKLRYPLPTQLAKRLTGGRLAGIRRRAKYLLFDIDRLPEDQTATLILHLGMSGSLRIVPIGTPPQPHDHVDIEFDDKVLRLRDPRRFGALLWHDPARPIEEHPLIAVLGVEPLEESFDGEWLHDRLRKRSGPIKPVLMDSHMVVGIGNIYAAESLFLSGISPLRSAQKISAARCDRLADAVKQTLSAAVAAGGSSVRDYVHSDGGAGCFQLQCAVYERESEPCVSCGKPIRKIRQAGRSTFYCPNCQK